MSQNLSNSQDKPLPNTQEDKAEEDDGPPSQNAQSQDIAPGKRGSGP